MYPDSTPLCASAPSHDGAPPAFWMPPYGEPLWAEVPAGEFWIGSEKSPDAERFRHKVHLERYQIAQIPITNAQYRLFVAATGVMAPVHWDGDEIPPGLERHPVVTVTWHDALAYCRWLSAMTGKLITLPSEAEWEVAACGGAVTGGTVREYPWGAAWEAGRCNSEELGLRDTTPVDAFPKGASPYGCLDMAGNVWEWTRSLCRAYPYIPDDGREDLSASDSVHRVLRGGSYYGNANAARCAYHYWRKPYLGFRDIGFRVCVALSCKNLSGGRGGYG
ncbi:MAG: formylglycine-generating enzyme family protein [Anaerolineae bacterium]|nr:formylglycine-generating enzyme family protein [Anaerolineae bacterium]